MAAITCDQCARSVPSIETTQVRGKTLCFDCDADLENMARVRRGIWVSIISAPAVSLLGWPMILPSVLFLGACAGIGPGFFALLGLIYGIRCIQMGLRLRGQEEDNGVTKMEPNLLFAGGGVAILSAIPLGGLALLWLLAGLLAVA